MSFYTRTRGDTCFLLVFRGRWNAFSARANHNRHGREKKLKDEKKRVDEPRREEGRGRGFFILGERVDGGLWVDKCGGILCVCEREREREREREEDGERERERDGERKRERRGKREDLNLTVLIH